MGTKTYCPEISGLNYIPLIFVYEISQPRTAQITVIPRKSIIKYKYNDEDVQTIEPQNCGNLTYQLTDFTPETCNDAIYRITYQITNAVSDNGYRFYRPGGYWGYLCGYNNQSGVRGNFWGRILDFRFTESFVVDSCIGINNTGYAPRGVVSGYKNLEVLCYGRWGEPRLENPEWFKVYGNPGDTRLVLNNETISWEVELVREFNCPPQCKFEVFEDGNLIYQEIREECPEVEFNNCILDYENQEIINLNLLPFETLYVANGITNIVEVFNFFNLINSALDNLPFVRDDDVLINYLQNILGGNESECSIIFSHLPFTLPNVIKQVCSSCNCSPPQITVECDSTNRCPANTCEVECNGTVCCYDENGISIYSFTR